ncbi:uncharacterized protein LOC131933914 [Physella acuta]|uniref:uncharacterized protein LOC131933914 n=1 Tax=Physella acuta TaxID=109671 RepID=UPI0027DC7FFE|nr:uncharacterized protein LOC131933914 [Physella acuta]
MGISGAAFMSIWEKEMEDQQQGLQSSQKGRAKGTQSAELLLLISKLTNEITALKSEAHQLRQEVTTLRSDLLNQNTEVIEKTVSRCLAQHFQEFEGKFKVTVIEPPATRAPSASEVSSDDDGDFKDAATNTVFQYFHLAEMEFRVYLNQLGSSHFHSKIISPPYQIANAPVSASLGCWLDEERQLCINAAIFSKSYLPLHPKSYFRVTGQIKNRNSDSFSGLFEGETRQLSELSPSRKEWFEISVCLKTCKRSYNNPTVGDLKQRGFVLDQSLVIQWDIEHKVYNSH